MSNKLGLAVFDSIEALFKSSLMKNYIESINDSVNADRIDFVLKIQSILRRT